MTPSIALLLVDDHTLFRRGLKALLEVAKSAGLSEAQVTACVSNPANGEALDARVAAGEARGVDSTPFFFVNGVKVDGVTLADLDKAIAAAGKAKPAKKK